MTELPQQDRDGIPFNWSAHPGGLPIRKGDSPNLLRQADINSAESVPVGCSEVLTIPEQKEKYDSIIDWIAKLNSRGAAWVRFEDRIPDREKPGVWHVWISWVELRGVIRPPTRGM